MVNPFTLQGKIRRIQQDVLYSLYTMYDKQKELDHSWLLAETGRAIGSHQEYIEELCQSRLVAAVFKVVKLLGGAEKLTEDDFNRFTSYVNSGGIAAMVKMLLSVDKEKVFLLELQRLPPETRENASGMLTKSSLLHKDFIDGFFKEKYGRLTDIPEKLIENFKKSTIFIERLADLAESDLKK